MVSFGIFHMLFSRNLLYILKKARIKAKFSRLYLDKIPPKGRLIVECGKLLADNGYKVRVVNTVNFQKSMHYNRATCSPLKMRRTVLFHSVL